MQTLTGVSARVNDIRRRGGNPRDVLEQITDFRKKAAELGLRFSTASAESAASDDDDDEGEQA